MATSWDVASVGWSMIVVGWLVSPIITFLLPKIISYLGFELHTSEKLRDLEFQIIPELEETLRAVDQERMLGRGEKVPGVVASLDKMAAMLRYAREDAEDIFDDEQEIKLYRNRFRHRLHRVAATFIARFKSSCVWIASIIRSGLARSFHRVPMNSSALATCIAGFNRSCMWVALTVWSGSARLLQWAWKIFLPSQKDVLPVTTNDAALSDSELSSTYNSKCEVSDEPVTALPDSFKGEASDEPVTAPPDSFNGEVSDEPVTALPDSSCWCSSFHFFNSCFWSTCKGIVDVFEFACTYRNLSYNMVGIRNNQKNATTLDYVLTAISRWKLKKRIEKLGNTINEVKKSPLLGVASNNKPDDITNKNRSIIRTASKQKVFGREGMRGDIMAWLRETPEHHAASSSASTCYSVTGIYGVAGTGKTTLARYVRDYIKEECKEEKLFDTIMCIHVTQTFSLDDIFHEMLRDITKDRHSNISDHEELLEKVKESLCGKRFFLILDDLWVENKNDPQLVELKSSLDVGKKGSKILVTARTKYAVGAMCVDEPIKMPDLDEEEYFSMFMHYALDGTRIVDKEFKSIGREIAKKLHRSPLAAATVAGGLRAYSDIRLWKNAAKIDMLNDTMDALWWSYQQLNPDIRRCFEFCSIFPRRFSLLKDQLVRLWVAQGFVKTNSATEDMEDVAEGYVQELVSCSFLQPKGTNWFGDDCFSIHDLLHDLLEKVAGNDYFRIENDRRRRGEGLKGVAPEDVRHLFVQNYDEELITKKILGLENLRTLIMYDVEVDTIVDEKVIVSICMRLPKLRVLAIAFNEKCELSYPNEKFLVPESIIQLKHLRYLAFQTSYSCKVILPSALAKLLHIQLLDFGNGQISDFNIAGLINLRHIFCGEVSFPHVGRLSSLQTVPFFTVKNEDGYEIKQLRDLNKLRGKLEISGLQRVKSKEEALEANLAAKERLTELALHFSGDIGWCEVEAEVFEGLCPPVGLEKLSIVNYIGTRYPDWMVGKLNGGPKDLQILYFYYCGHVGPGPELEVFPHLRRLMLWKCSWDALPGNMEHLTSLQTLRIDGCKNIRSLPTLPQSLKVFYLWSCDDELMKGCQTDEDPNWLKIKHIPEKDFYPRLADLISEEGSCDDSEEGPCDDSEEGPSHASEAYNVIVHPKRERKKGRWVRFERRVKP